MDNNQFNHNPESPDPGYRKTKPGGNHQEMFLVLTTKEKEVIIKRFSLDNKPKQTLEKIRQMFSVTRERIRQIEKIALGKLRRRSKHQTKCHQQARTRGFRGQRQCLAEES